MCSAKGRSRYRRTPTRIALLQTLGIVTLCGPFWFCVAACGSGAEITRQVTTTTTGQQLIDLKKALDSGAITKEEYEKERKKILDR